jgi:hypothetical protein
MRILLVLAAGLSAASIGTAAAARPAGGTAFGRVSPHPNVSNGGGRNHPGRGGGYVRFGGGGWKGNDHWSGDRHWAGDGHWTGGGDWNGDGGHRRFGRSDGNDFVAYGSGGIEWPVDGLDRHGNGFFAGGGGQIQLQGGRPHYDYDRSYPYEFASAAARGGGGQARAAGEPTVQSRPRCTMQSGVRVCRGW